MLVLSLFLFVTCMGGRSPSAPFARAAEEVTVEDYEARNVLDDLQGATIGGNVFKLEDYAFQANGRPQVLSFIEYGYSFYEDKQADFGLYLYVYNPQGKALDEHYNALQFRAGRAADYTKYDLTVLNYSVRPNYEGMFYKFKVSMTDEQREEILSNVEQKARTYTVSGLELSIGGNKTDYAVGSTYTFTGFAEGYGSELQIADGLTCKVDKYDSYITLDVKQTVYRPQGDFYNGEQAQLNSCFFRVPNTYFDKYGDLSKILCEWWEYVTKKALIAEDIKIYQLLEELKGKPISQSSLDALLLTFVNSVASSLFAYQAEGSWSSNIAMKTYDDGHEYYSYHNRTLTLKNEWKYNGNFSGVFHTGGASYSEYGVSSEEVQAKLKEYSKALGNTAIRGKYAEELFESFVQEGRTRGYNKKEITTTDTADIFWNYTTKDLLQIIFGGKNVETLYDSKPAIQIISKDDLKGTSADIAQRLYVNEADVGLLKQEFVKAGSEEKLVLLRYATSTYYSYPTITAWAPNGASADEEVAKITLGKWKNIQNSEGDYDAYCAQQTVFLDFDIISLTFTRDDVDTVIPCVANPTDAIGGYSPPLEENYHTDGNSWLTWLLVALAIIVLIILCIFVPPVLRVVMVVLKALWALLKALFKLIAKPFKALFRAIEKKVNEEKTDDVEAHTQAPKKTTSTTKSKTTSRKKSMSKHRTTYKSRKPTPTKRRRSKRK